MKRIFLALFFIALFNICYSKSYQDTSKHLTFKGVPLDGTLDEFVLKMKKSGFEHIGTEKGYALLQGDFASYKGCSLGVSNSKGKGSG